MQNDTASPQLTSLDEALESGGSQAIRDSLLALTPAGREALEMRLGRAAVDRILKQTRRTRVAPKGRVVVLHGIMGAQLNSIEKSEERRIWVNPYHLYRGRIFHLKLNPDGSPANKNIRVELAGMMYEYLPLLAELAWKWEVMPFAYDWRIDIDVSADRLKDKIEQWATDKPCHLVAHSMGGLVSRRFIQRYPDTWKSMQDPDGRGRGGRLIMLGTPNKGSFAVPQILTGQEKYVRWLEKLDREHDLPGVLEIVDTFAGSYQMLPSPKVLPGDDRAKLFERKSWGQHPVTQDLLDHGRAFQEALDAVVDLERMIYVAGYDQRTLHRIKVNGPGQFTYQETLDGDGRVPHELGLLDGVPTYWVREAHGDLPRNSNVLEGIHDLLATGATAAMPRQRPASRSAVKVMQQWTTPAEAELPAELKELLARQRGRGKKATVDLSEPQAVRLASLLVEDYLGRAPEAELAGGAGSRRASALGPSRQPPTIHFDVVWGDITRVQADVYAAGSYEGVAPISALSALDARISSKNAQREDRVLASLIRRGSFGAGLGDIRFFPWAEEKFRHRLVAIAGMGRPGTFGRSQLRQLTRSLAATVAALPHVSDVATVVIGSGDGNVPLEQAVEDMLTGMADALASDDLKSPITKVMLVEMNYDRAERVRRVIAALAASPEVQRRVIFKAPKLLRRSPGNSLGQQFGLSLVGLAAAKAAKRSRSTTERKALDRVLSEISDKHLRAKAGELLSRMRPDERTLHEQALDMNLRGRSDRDTDPCFSTRFSYVWDGRVVSATVLTDTAVITERPIGLDKKLIDQLASDMIDPPEEKVASLSALLARLIVPRDFRAALDNAPSIVFEVDRELARVHWEMLGGTLLPGKENLALSLVKPVSRQLRTSYSPPPSQESGSRRKLRVLVVGDPGDPDRGEDLPGAREEALQVVKMLRDRTDVIEEVVAMIGAPGARRDGALRDFPPATRLEVLASLTAGGYDILHYCGHGDFDPVQPDVAGWVFKDGLLTSRELERVDLAPRLVVANACLSGLASTRVSGGGGLDDLRSEAALLPSLADEFFKRGVRQYIGTAWEVNDVGAILFARKLYEELLKQPVGTSLGHALQTARKALNEKERTFGALWAAYQHYGDPNFKLIEAGPRR